jgi:hypothetical protein
MSRFQKTSVRVLLIVILLASHNAAFAQQKEMMVRISEIEIDAQYLEQLKPS